MQPNEPLLISTSRQLVYWDGSTCETVQKGRGLYYGITWDEEFIYVVSRTSEPHRVQVLDSSLTPVGYVPFRNMGLDPHQAHYHDRVLYVANRDRRCIQCWDFDTTREYSTITSSRDNHYNSIWIQYGHFWIVEHRQNRMPKVIRVYDQVWNHVASFAMFIKPQERSHGIHNVYVEGNNIMTLAPDCLIIVTCHDLQAGYDVHKQTLLKLPGIKEGEHYMRGFARTPNYFYFGVSDWSCRAERDRGTSWILVLDNNLSRVGEIALPAETGQVTEIRALDGDLAHNGLRCPYV